MQSLINDRIITKYKYTSLADMTTSNQYNFYGIVIDSSFPSNNTLPESHYECILKVIDISYTHSSPIILTLIIKSRSKNQIPYIHKIGDVIRIINGTFKPKSKAYLNLLNESVAEKGSWCVFDGDNYTIYGGSSSSIPFEQRDLDNVASLSQFYKSLVGEENVLYARNEKLINRKDDDRDAIVLVAGKEELDDKVVFFVQDETDACELHAFKYFNFVNVGDVIRVRSYRLFNQTVMVLNQWGNILLFNKASGMYKKFMNQVIEVYNTKMMNTGTEVHYKFDEGYKKNKKATKTKEDKELIISVSNAHSSTVEIPFSSLTQKDSTFILTVSVIHMSPINPILNSINVLCPNCNNTFDISEVELTKKNTFKCPSCDTEVKAKLHFNMKILAKENAFSDDIIQLYLCDYDNEGENFLGAKAEEVLANGNEIKRIERNIKNILNEKSRVRVLVERCTENVLRIIGKYSYKS